MPSAIAAHDAYGNPVTGRRRRYAPCACEIPCPSFICSHPWCNARGTKLPWCFGAADDYPGWCDVCVGRFGRDGTLLP
jgi:hypothetical protein